VRCGATAAARVWNGWARAARRLQRAATRCGPAGAAAPPQRVAARRGAALAPPRPSAMRLAIALCCCRVRWLLVTEEISQVELSRCRGV